MKRFELWLTTVIMFSLPALAFAQATGGSTDTLIHRKGAGTGRKGTAQAEIRKKGSGNAPRTTGPLNPQPLPPRNPAPLAGNGSGNAPKTTGTTTPPPKAGKLAGKFIEEVAVPAGKAKWSKPTAANKGSNAPEAPRSKGN